MPLKNVVKKVLRLERILDIVERQHKNRHVVAALVRDERMSRRRARPIARRSKHWSPM